MSSLDDFLGLADVSQVKQAIKIKVGDKVLDLVVRPISQSEHRDYQKMAMNFSDKKNTFDISKYNQCVLDNNIVEPDFHNAEFLHKAGCASAKDFFQRKFTAGVIIDICNKIQEISGFGSFDEAVDEAKN